MHIHNQEGDTAKNTFYLAIILMTYIPTLAFSILSSIFSFMYLLLFSTLSDVMLVAPVLIDVPIVLLEVEGLWFKDFLFNGFLDVGVPSFDKDVCFHVFHADNNSAAVSAK